LGNRVRKLSKGEEIFKEGDHPECMYIIRSGRVAITKIKGESQITLAELKNGDMIGEMGFFEKKPRSAGARAVTPTEVIELPFVSLEKQYNTLPVWLKAVMKTVTAHLRKANTKIRQLEKSKKEEDELFDLLTMTQLAAILGSVAHRFGTPQDDGSLQVHSGLLRKYTIQVFQLSTSKMQMFVEVLSTHGIMKLKPLKEGKQSLFVLKLDFLFQFVDFFTNQYFSEEAKKFDLSLNQLTTIKTIISLSVNQSSEDEKKSKKFSVINVTNISSAPTVPSGTKIGTHDVRRLSDLGLLGEYTSDGPSDFVEADIPYLQEISEYWDVFHSLKALRF